MSSLKLREAVRNDRREFEELVSLKIAAFSDLPLWNYWYPDRESDKSALRNFVRGQFLTDSNDCAKGTHEMLVVEENAKIIAYSVWQTVVTKPEEPKAKPGKFSRRSFKRIAVGSKLILRKEESSTVAISTSVASDPNKTRINETIKASQSVLRDVFWKKYDKRQCRLVDMGTHPNHLRKGAARMMLDFALKKATKDQVAIVLFASPMGREVYKRAGFKDLEEVTVQIGGEKEYLEMFCWHAIANRRNERGMVMSHSCRRSTDVC